MSKADFINAMANALNAPAVSEYTARKALACSRYNATSNLHGTAYTLPDGSDVDDAEIDLAHIKLRNRQQGK